MAGNNINQKVKQIGASDSTCNVRSLNRTAFVLLGNQKSPTCEIRDKDCHIAV